MSMANLLEAFNLIERNKLKGIFSGKKKESLIRLAEKELQLKFPPTYRIFLQEYGCGGLEGQEIYGIVDEDFHNSSVPDGIWLTLEERKKWNYPFPLIIIEDTGDGYWYALDSSVCDERGEYPVVVYYPEEPNNKHKYEKISEDFGDFLLRSTQDVLKKDEEE